MKNKGISLIVLIITIVVIIILATAIIVNIAETNIIGNANEAVVKQDIKTFQDELDLYIADQYANMKGGFDIATVNANTLEEVVKYIASVENSKYEDYIAIANGKVVIKSTMQEPQRTWAMEALNEEKYGIATVNNVVEGKNATINGENPTYNNPVIPVGFKAVNYGASWEVKNGVVDGWNDGLVIVDESGNEFVWVPVDGTNVTYTKKFEQYPKNATITNVTDDLEVLPVSNENTQVIKYGGFYIGRYEAGVPENQTEEIKIDGVSANTSNKQGIPVVKKDATVWTYIDYNMSNTNTKSLINTQYVKSGLVTGTQWDTMCTWIQSEKDTDNNIIHDVINSSKTWGNYSNSESPANVTGYKTKQTAGYSDYWKAKNIYDIAGNTVEWTTEIYSNERIGRGGGAVNDGATSTAAFRNAGVPTRTSGNISFRIVLYII